MTTAPLIFGKLVAVMCDIGAVSKSRRNTQQSYNFRGVDDLYNEVHEILAKHGVFTAPTVLSETYEERSSKGGGTLVYRVLKVQYRFYAEDGSHFDAVTIGEGMDSGDKASNKAMSAAHKYALLQVFCIPTEESKDAEEDSHEVEPRQAAAAAQAAKPAGPTPYSGTPQERAVVDDILKRQKVPETFWPEIHAAMMGRQPNELAAVVAEIRKRAK